VTGSDVERRGRLERSREERKGTMESISLTYFVDFMLTSGTGRLTSARNIQKGPDERYSDFYRPAREAIMDMHRKGLDTRALVDFQASLVDPREQRLFPNVLIGYGKFLRRQTKVTWFEPPQAELRLGGMSVRVNPELGLLLGGEPHAIKLYFRGEPLSPQRAVLANEIMADALADTWPKMVFAVLDVRRAKLFPYERKADVSRLVRAEAASLASLLSAA
jgi:hypothetical protein